MTTALTFQSTTFNVIDRNGQPWIQSKQLAQALGYKLENSVQKIYERNADEFTPAMSEKVNLTLSGNLTTAVRIFSLRGCHLIAMFARTPVAKAFRRWVLDVLDELNENGGIASPADLSSLSTAKSRKPLRGLVNAWAQLTGVHPSVLWPQVKAHFSLSRIDDLPEAWIPDALAFVQEKIDGLAKQREALPPPAAVPPQPMVQGTLSQGTLVPPQAWPVPKDAESMLKLLHKTRQQCQWELLPHGYTLGDTEAREHFKLAEDLFKLQDCLWAALWCVVSAAEKVQSHY